jgi:hypothetical protein
VPGPFLSRRSTINREEMIMTVAFDGSTDSGTASSAPAAPQPDYTGLDTLSVLKQSVAERIEIEPVVLHVPGGRIRLVCIPDIPEKELRRWQRASLPPDKRKNGTGSPLDQNQLVIGMLVLTFTCERIEVLDPRDKNTWHVVQHGGEPLALDSDVVLREFGAMDAQYLLTKLFGRESDVIRASQEVLAAAGWTGENGGDEDDPR